MVLGVVALVAVARLLFGDDPWNDGIAGRLAEGKDVRPEDYQVTYGFWAWGLLAVGAAGLLATARRWAPGDVPVRPALAPARPAPAFLCLVGLAVATLAYQAGPRLTHSLWQDEDHTARTYVAGGYLPDAEGRLKFWDSDWEDALLYDWGPNNPIGYSVAAKLTTSALSLAAGRRDERADDVALRAPAFAFALLGVAALGWLGLWLGFPMAGAFAGLALALHPWHLRFAAEARGYSLVLLLGTLGVVLLLRALTHGSWRRWLLYGASQVVLLWTFAAGIHAVLLTNLAAAGALWRLYGRGAGARVAWTRFLVVNLAGAGVWLVLMAGNLAILADYLEEKGSRALGLTWGRELLGLVALGTPWSHGAAGEDPVYPEMVDLLARHAMGVAAWAGASLAALAVGAVRLARGHPAGGLLLLPYLVAGPLTWAVAALRGDFLYARNLVFVLPPLALLLGIGLVGAPAGRAARGAAVGLALAWLALFVALSHPARTALHTRSFVPYKESVLASAGTLDPFDPGRDRVLTASFSAEPYYYDPWVHLVEEPEELRGLMARADAEGIPLFVNLGRLGLARRREPELMALVGSPAFEEVAVLPAFEPHFTRHVYRYRGARGR